MSELRGVAAHVAILVAAIVVAVAVWTKEDTPASKEKAEVEIWAGATDKVEKIALDSENRTVVAEAKKDSNGRYFVVTLDKAIPPKSEPPKRLPDGGLKKADPPKGPLEREKKVFISVKAANELAEQLAPLMGLRSVGKIEEARAEEFGFHENKGTVKVWIGGTERSLTLGGSTPGGADRYVKDGSGSVFVIAGAIARDLETAETRLIERALHGFEADDVKKVELSLGDATRELVRTGSGRTAKWADPATPDQEDETASNWMSKVERLRVTEYIEGSAADQAGDDLVVKVEYYGDSGKLGFMELVKVPAEAPGGAQAKDDFIARSEQTRWFAKVTRSVGEQVAQDVGSVVK